MDGRRSSSPLCCVSAADEPFCFSLNVRCHQSSIRVGKISLQMQAISSVSSSCFRLVFFLALISSPSSPPMPSLVLHHYSSLCRSRHSFVGLEDFRQPSLARFSLIIPPPQLASAGSGDRTFRLSCIIHTLC